MLAFGAAAAPSLDLGLSWRQFRTVEAALADVRRVARRATSTRCATTPATTCSASWSPRSDDGVGLDERELKATAGLVLAAGFETTVNLLGNGVALLDAHRDQLELLREPPSCGRTRSTRSCASTRRCC